MKNPLRVVRGEGAKMVEILPQVAKIAKEQKQASEFLMVLGGTRGYCQINVILSSSIAVRCPPANTEFYGKNRKEGRHKMHGCSRGV